jgi:hypothetical protein
MATKMNATIAKRVKTLGINVKTEEEAREKLIEILASNGIDGMDDEDIDTLIEIAESFVEDENNNDDSSEEDENDELAKEVMEEEKPVKKSSKPAVKKVEVEDEEEDEEEEDDEEDDEDEKPVKKSSKPVVKKVEEDEEEEDDEDEKPVKKSSKPVKKSSKITKKVEVEEEDEDEKPVLASNVKVSKKSVEKVPAKKVVETGKTDKKSIVKLDPKNNEEDRKAFKPLHKLFPESEYVYNWISKSGVTIKYKGKNSNRSLVLIENCLIQKDDSIKCTLYFLIFTKSKEPLDKAGIEYEVCWSGAPFIKGITLLEAIEIITGFMGEITATVQKIDKKLGENRNKMEENLNKKPVAKKISKKK